LRNRGWLRLAHTGSQECCPHRAPDHSNKLPASRSGRALV
jgi:hypothetical protein